jgi:hypothetical protein
MDHHHPRCYWAIHLLLNCEHLSKVQTYLRNRNATQYCFTCMAVLDEKIDQIWLFRVIPNLQYNKVVAVLTVCSLSVPRVKQPYEANRD